MKQNNMINKIVILCYGFFVLASFQFDFIPGKRIGYNFFVFFVDMIQVLPCVFVLIGLFEVWVKKEIVEKHLGEESGFMGYVWAILLASNVVGGLYVAFPVAYSLFSKGAKLSVVFTFIGAAAVCRIPMTLFEASFIGIKFTIVRLVVSLPLVVATSIILGSYLSKRNYTMHERL
ncbi:MAG: hypothetical protein GF384_07445 [Elusimicrobia bacterium]|nr:hypothetical protein [Elusimicrobiota bacterium]MBD3412491.1 hypothetical protein [Elusimicrobiota bacterium]